MAWDLALWRGVAKSRGAVGDVGVFPAFLERAQSVHQADSAGSGGGQPVRLGGGGGREEGRGEEEVLVRVQAGEVVGPDGADEVDEVLRGAEQEFVAVVEHVAGFVEEEALGAEGDEEVGGRGGEVPGLVQEGAQEWVRVVAVRHDDFLR